MTSIDYPDFNPFDVRDAFFEFILSLMKNYNKYWVRLFSFRIKIRSKLFIKMKTSQ